MRVGTTTWLSLVLMVALLPNAVPAQSTTEQLLGKIGSVEREGKGNAGAAAAARELAKSGTVEALIPILKAMDGADIRVVNWLRPTGEAIVDRAMTAKAEFPVAALETFVLDTKHAGHARRTAYEWLTRLRPDTPDRLVSRFLDDPAAELRRDAIALEMKKAQALAEKDHGAAAKVYQAAFDRARDSDQVQQIAAALQKLDGKVDVVAHLGFVEHWKLLAPFDNKGEKGFAVAYPPEKGVDLSAKMKGSDAAEIAWQPHTVKDPENETDPEKLGIVDLNVAIGKKKGAICYAVAYVDSPKEQPVEVRIGSWNANKIFLNGKEIFGIEEYHHGMKLDQYVGHGTLKKGKNEILLKVCQNEETAATSQNWRFQLRLCDTLGKAIPFKVID